MNPRHQTVASNTHPIVINSLLLESVLAGPSAQFIGFDDHNHNNPVYLDEFRSSEELNTIISIQNGITNYLSEILSLYDLDLFNANINSFDINEIQGFLAMMMRDQIDISSFRNHLRVDDKFCGRNIHQI